MNEVPLLAFVVATTLFGIQSSAILLLIDYIISRYEEQKEDIYEQG